MAVLQRNTNGVLSRGADGVLVRAVAADPCCCDGETVAPARLCSDGSLYVFSGHISAPPGNGVAACGALRYWRGRVHNGLFFETTECIYFDPADCRAADPTDHILIAFDLWDSCEECETALP